MYAGDTPMTERIYEQMLIESDIGESERCLCNEGIHDGKRIDCRCKIHCNG